MVPPSLRAAIEGVAGVAASCKDLVIIRGAIDAVAHYEARTAARAPRWRAKAVQLALFDV
jgi:hypothetical protein